MAGPNRQTVRIGNVTLTIELPLVPQLVPFGFSPLPDSQEGMACLFDFGSERSLILSCSAGSSEMDV